MLPDGSLDHISIRTRVEFDPDAHSLVTSASQRSNDGQIHGVSRFESAHRLSKFVDVSDPNVVHGQHQISARAQSPGALEKRQHHQLQGSKKQAADPTRYAQSGRPGLAVQASARRPAAGINADYLESVLLHTAIAFGRVFQGSAQAWRRKRFVFRWSKILLIYIDCI